MVRRQLLQSSHKPRRQGRIRKLMNRKSKKKLQRRRRELNSTRKILTRPGTKSRRHRMR